MPERTKRRIHETGHVRKFLVVLDETPECETAVYFGAARARSTGSMLTMLFVVEPPGFSHWLAVEERAREEGERKAEALFRMYRQKLEKWGFGELKYEQVIRYGGKCEQIRELENEDPDISFLVLGAATGGEGPGRLVTNLITRGAQGFPTPIVIVPGDMTFEEIDALA
ncbi:MAG TPA: universal stress protein [Thermopetrobacter sp.]|nr:universal stress protein [Thermopetrobacter sp.]